MEFKEIVAEIGSELKKETFDRKKLVELINGAITAYNQVVTNLKNLSQDDDRIGALKKDLEKGEKKYKKKVIDLQTIFEIAKELTSSLELDHLIKSIVLTTMGHLLVESAALFVLDEGLGRYVLRSAKGFKDDLTRFVFSRDDELIKLAAANAKPQPSSAFPSSAGTLKSMNCELVVPIMSKSTLVGLLMLGPRAGSMPYSDSHFEFLSALGNFAAIAIDNAKLYHRLESRIRELSTLYSVSREINKITEMETVITLMLDTITVAFGVSQCSVVLYDELKGIFHIEKNVGCDEETAKARLKIILEKSDPLKTGDPVLVPSQPGMAEGDILFSIPLIAGSRKVGLLNVFRFDEGTVLNEEMQQLFSIVASQMAPPILLAQFFSSRNLYHEQPFDYTFNALSEMIQRASAADSGFITVRLVAESKNTSYASMKEMLDGVRKVLQPTDIFIHVALNEFILICPACTLQEITTLIDGVISNLLQMKVRKVFASFPEEGSDANTLLTRLYSSSGE
jgi:transcriptional regulator with GAF, ATPase, and Fis domain